MIQRRRLISGLLLLRVRDELRMTLHAFQTLYESSIAFGIRKALQAEQGKTDMETRISRLEDDKAGLEKEVSDLKRYTLPSPFLITIYQILIKGMKKNFKAGFY